MSVYHRYLADALQVEPAKSQDASLGRVALSGRVTLLDGLGVTHAAPDELVLYVSSEDARDLATKLPIAATMAEATLLRVSARTQLIQLAGADEAFREHAIELARRALLRLQPHEREEVLADLKHPL